MRPAAAAFGFAVQGSIALATPFSCAPGQWAQGVLAKHIVRVASRIVPKKTTTKERLGARQLACSRFIGCDCSDGTLVLNVQA
jgi:hypothetical protein